MIYNLGFAQAVYNSWRLHEGIDLYECNDSSLYLILLEASQAFDRVKYV